MAGFFSKVSAGLAQISETSRFRDRDKTETLAIRDQDQGSETRDLQKLVLRPRPRPGFETTTLMCSSIFSESSPVRSKSGIINELSGFPNSVSNSAMRLHQLQLAWSYRPCILHLLCRKTLVLSAEFGTKIKFDLSTFIQKLLVFIKNYSTTHRSDKMSHFSYLEILISGESYQSKTRYTYSKW